MVNGHAAIRSNTKIYLAGRTVRIEWNDTNEPDANYLILFANDGWLRLQVVETGKEFVTAASNVWRITEVHERA